MPEPPLRALLKDGLDLGVGAAATSAAAAYGLVELGLDVARGTFSLPLVGGAPRLPSPWDVPSPGQRSRYTEAVLDPLRQVGDDPVDDAVRRHAEAAGKDPKARIERVLALVETLRKKLALPSAGIDRTLLATMRALGVRPQLDEARIARATDLFVEDGFLMTLILSTSSLLEAYACWRGVTVLNRTGQLRTNVYRRLAESLQWVLLIEEPRGFARDGKAIDAILKVRLMHGAIRYLLLNGDERLDPLGPAWDRRKLGVPICQEDLLGMLMGFSAVVIRDLPKLGVQVTPSTAADHLYLWTKVGPLLGIQERLLPATMSEAMQLIGAIQRRQQASSENGRVLAAALLAFHRWLIPGHIFDSVAVGLMRRTAGNRLCDMLAIPRSVLGSIEFELVMNAFRGLAELWGNAIITHEGFQVPKTSGDPRPYRRKTYTVPRALAEGWDRRHPDWRRAHITLSQMGS